MIDTAKVLAATTLAALAHDGQVRKYTGEPYIVHPLEVAALVTTSKNANTDVVIAAILHDVVEDTTISIETIRKHFGTYVAYLVNQLTEVVIEGNRETRKAAECARLATISPYAQTVKYCDLISNTADIAKHDKSFAKQYLKEKRAILDVMNKGDPELWRMADEQVTRLTKELNLA